MSTIETLVSLNGRRLGNWLPPHESTLAAFRDDLNDHIRESQPSLVPAVKELSHLIKTDPFLMLHLEKAIEQAQEAGYILGYRNVKELVVLINGIITMPPKFSHSELIGCPLNILLDWIMCVPAGSELFRSIPLNNQLKKVLTAWGKFLSSPNSRKYLTADSPEGWFCEEADQTLLLHETDYDSSKEYGGYTSWNDFFLRKFKPGARPIAQPSNDKIITSACEAIPFNSESEVKLQDKFWIKSQSYSLFDIFSPIHSDLARTFSGGMVYQAYLTPYDYHRWHAPISGTIVEAYNVAATYCSEVESEDANHEETNGVNGSIAAVASRAIVVIKSDDSKIGLVACIFVGMAEISSCKIEVKKSYYVRKGDELGFFQFGGSSHCLLFQPGVIRNFELEATPNNLQNQSAVKVCSKLAVTN